MGLWEYLLYPHMCRKVVQLLIPGWLGSEGALLLSRLAIDTFPMVPSFCAPCEGVQAGLAW